ncbi:DUF6804 family protein [Mycetocola zhadangensis]|uniref:DUF6804 family protein n=1 Tax=Mycetocola zhadangensis TaxID=1164595 RepID=UPI003A4D8280
MRSADRQTGTPVDSPFLRSALAPGLLGAIVLMAGLALLDIESFTIIRYAVSILALIVCVFVIQAKAWWWLLGLVPIAVIWNPVIVIELHGQGWVSAQFIAALVLIIIGVRLKVPVRRNDTPAG